MSLVVLYLQTTSFTVHFLTRDSSKVGKRQYNQRDIILISLKRKLNNKDDEPHSNAFWKHA
ncbi:conserved hypothetical protein [Trichinella spiralis]|uniref:hypothetical protein n=1 Tax=Trichinella spiralis TaxID=6334 RepID=UPI0001EFB781|nr:conserved hypothetical protein [Trichinella spiralis]